MKPKSIHKKHSTKTYVEEATDKLERLTLRTVEIYIR